MEVLGVGILSLANKAYKGIKALRAAKKVGKVIDDVNNPVPDEMARVVESKFSESPTLGAPSADDVFVTAADDIRDVKNSKELAEKLTLKKSDGTPVEGPFQVTEFKTPESGVASPVNRTDPGFVGKGKTEGGAREFVIPNKKIEDLKNVNQKRIE